MRWTRLLRLAKGKRNRVPDEKVQLIGEINQAKMEWSIARERLNYALEEDQIDYVIFMLEAAEKRYGMLLRNAKKINLNLLDVIEEGKPQNMSSRYNNRISAGE